MKLDSSTKISSVNHIKEFYSKEVLSLLFTKIVLNFLFISIVNSIIHKLVIITNRLTFSLVFLKGCMASEYNPAIDILGSNKKNRKLHYIHLFKKNEDHNYPTGKNCNYTLKKCSLFKVKNNSSWVNFTHFREITHLLSLELIFISPSWRV